jgi:DNA-directed RNA polymerase II subunit RPB1
MIHIIFKECGPKACADFLSNSQFIINSWIAGHGHTVGIQDAISKPDTKIDIKKTIDKYCGKV